LLGFDHPVTVRSDSDWDALALAPDAGVALRYVLVPTANGWELRLGRTSAESAKDLSTGSHRHMFSQAEQRRAEKQGLRIRSGYIYGIEPDCITFG
jgi:hypothetical protein